MQSILLLRIIAVKMLLYENIIWFELLKVAVTMKK